MAIVMSSKGITRWIILVVILLLVVLFLIRRFYLKKNNDSNEDNQIEAFNNSSSALNDKPKKISTMPSFLGLQKVFTTGGDYYFDNEFFYAVNDKKQVSKYKLSKIVELSSTGEKINNRRIWKEVLKEQDTQKKVTFRFVHNCTLWNKNFVELQSFKKGKS